MLKQANKVRQEPNLERRFPMEVGGQKTQNQAWSSAQTEEGTYGRDRYTYLGVQKYA